ncbi:MAG TPA: type II toxin-antitoxin system VapC family toxin [Phenylobacterium sp.]|nr:type II toxin-antitoxin system VapC family toxin [Phenylobacterium sp.]
MRPILLDTCAALWSVEGGLSAGAVAAIVEADEAGVPVFVSPITAWEIGLLVARGRITLPIGAKRWFSSMLDAGVQLAPLIPETLIDASFLPPPIHGDPADRILAATAREHGYRLMTRDRPLLDYGAAGHLQVIAC